jgi:predicted  nucleic acid-binding Zn-ribbon protein
MNNNVFEGLCPSCGKSIFVKVKNDLNTFSQENIAQTREALREELLSMDEKGELSKDVSENMDTIINRVYDEDDVSMILISLRKLNNKPEKNDNKKNTN